MPKTDAMKPHGEIGFPGGRAQGSMMTPFMAHPWVQSRPDLRAHLIELQQEAIGHQLQSVAIQDPDTGEAINDVRKMTASRELSVT